jgi:hypothetical protein
LYKFYPIRQDGEQVHQVRESYDVSERVLQLAGQLVGQILLASMMAHINFMT